MPLDGHKVVVGYSYIFLSQKPFLVCTERCSLTDIAVRVGLGCAPLPNAVNGHGQAGLAVPLRQGRHLLKLMGVGWTGKNSMKTLHIKLKKMILCPRTTKLSLLSRYWNLCLFFSYADTGFLWSVFLPLMVPLAAILESTKLSRLISICFIFNSKHTCFCKCLKKINSKMLK